MDNKTFIASKNAILEENIFEQPKPETIGIRLPDTIVFRSGVYEKYSLGNFTHIRLAYAPDKEQIHFIFYKWSENTPTPLYLRTLTLEKAKEKQKAVFAKISALKFFRLHKLNIKDIVDEYPVHVIPRSIYKELALAIVLGESTNKKVR